MSSSWPKPSNYYIYKLNVVVTSKRALISWLIFIHSFLFKYADRDVKDTFHDKFNNMADGLDVTEY